MLNSDALEVNPTSCPHPDAFTNAAARPSRVNHVFLLNLFVFILYLLL